MPILRRPAIALALLAFPCVLLSAREAQPAAKSAAAASRESARTIAAPETRKPATQKTSAFEQAIFNGSKVERISLREALNMALGNNLEVKFEKIGIRVEQAKVRFEAGAFDPTFSINMSRESLRRPENAADFTSTDQLRQSEQTNAINANTIAANNQAIAANNQANAILAANGLPPNNNLDLIPLSTANTTSGIFNTIFDQQSDRFSSSLIQRTPWGMRYGFFVEANRLRNTFSRDTRDVLPEYQTSTSVQVVQPLLKDFGPAANLANLRVARVGRQVAVLAWKQRLMSGMQAVMSAYNDMTFHLANVRVRQDAIDADQRLVSQTQRRFELGFMQPFDVQQALAQVSSDQEALLVAKNSLMESQFALKRLILDQFNVNDTRIFLPIEEPSLGVPGLDRSAFLRQAFANRPDFQKVLLEADAQDIRLRFARNQLLPQLDLVATYGLNGLTGEYSDSFSQGFEGHTPAWTVGVNLRIPLGNVQARAQLDSVKAQKEQAILKIKQSELGIGVDVDTVISRIEANRQRVETARNTRELYSEAVRIAYRRLEEGQISSFDIIEQQRRLYDAKSRELAARTELNKSVTQLWLVTGTVLEKTGIQVEDMEKKKKPR